MASQRPYQTIEWSLGIVRHCSKSGHNQRGQVSELSIVLDIGKIFNSKKNKNAYTV